MRKFDTTHVDFRTRPASVSGDALFRAVRRGLLQHSWGKTTWRRCIIFRRDAVIHFTSTCADLAWSGSDDVLSLIRGARLHNDYVITNGA